jgi:predicted ester cyclase
VFKDFKVVNEEFITSANKVVVRSTNTGVQVSAFLGHPATNKPFTMTSIDIHTICNGRIIESRHVEDWLSTLVQLGALPIKSPGAGSNPGK